MPHGRQIGGYFKLVEARDTKRMDHDLCEANPFDQWVDTLNLQWHRVGKNETPDREIDPGMILKYLWTHVHGRRYALVGHLNDQFGVCDDCREYLSDFESWAWLPGYQEAIKIITGA